MKKLLLLSLILFGTLYAQSDYKQILSNIYKLDKNKITIESVTKIEDIQMNEIVFSVSEIEIKGIIYETIENKYIVLGNIIKPDGTNIYALKYREINKSVLEKEDLCLKDMKIQ